ncbi:helix-turn-helix transcriptional regulator [Nonomuraea longicatena]|uniref:Helix-turn-helix transcriptional regulator n=1 Tax=Nonomuraea longicatena TaxID=83682 RepID=A0ABN1PWN0_9ACTN
MHDATVIGNRLRTLRKWRGLTLVELAGMAGMSKTHLSDIERGLKALDRRSYVASLSTALRVSEADLVGGPHLTQDPVQAGPHSTVPQMRIALQTNTLTEPATDRAREVGILTAEVKQLEDVFARCDYVTLGSRLPGIIDELHFHAARPQNEAAQRDSLTALVEACMYATFRMKDLGYGDLAHQAATRAEEAARLLGDPVALGKAAYCRIQTMPREAGWDRKLTAARRAADTLQPHVRSAEGTAVLGMLILTSALAAAVAYRLDDARDGLAEARDLANYIDDDPCRNWSAFSITNVGAWGVALAVESGESGGAVLEKARIVDESLLLGRPSRRATFLADVGRGLAREQKTAKGALGWMLRAEGVAPQRIRNSPQVREAVAVMIQRSKVAASGRELRGLAARMGIPH